MKKPIRIDTVSRLKPSLELNSKEEVEKIREKIALIFNIPTSEVRMNLTEKLTEEDVNNYHRMLRDIEQNGHINLISHNIDNYCRDFLYATGKEVNAEKTSDDETFIITLKK